MKAIILLILILLSTIANGQAAKKLLLMSDVFAINIDYLIITYQWGTSDGVDLDSMTEYDNTGLSDVDDLPMGWPYTPSNGYNYQYRAFPTSNNDSLLLWGGDNVTSGQETIVINIKKLKTYSSIPDEVYIEMYANWWSQKLTGDSELKIDGYSGGTLSKTGTVYTCDGTKVINGDLLQKNVPAANIAIQPANAISNFRTLYTHVAKVTYYKTDDRVVMSLY